MFAASIIICYTLTGQPGEPVCYPVFDTLGPYQTIEECIARTKEMVDPITQMIANLLGEEISYEASLQCDDGREENGYNIHLDLIYNF